MNRRIDLRHCRTAKLLMTMALHIASDHGSVEHVEGSKQRCGAVALVVVGHRSGTSLLQGKPRLGTIESLNLAHKGICGSRCSDQDSKVNLRSLLHIQGLSPFA